MSILPLENVLLQLLVCGIDYVECLKHAPTPPAKKAIEGGIRELFTIGAIMAP